MLHKIKQLRGALTALAILAISGSLFSNCSGFKSIYLLESFEKATVDDFSAYNKPLASPAMRPLSVREFNNSLKVLLLDESEPGKNTLPDDAHDPFDNIIETSGVSAAKVEGLELLAADIAQSFVGDAARLEQVIPCVPTSATDEICLKNIVEKMGFMFFRRPLVEEEVTSYLALVNEFAGEQSDYKDGVEVYVRFLLQHPNFLYRSELGVVEGSAFRLNDYELITKVSFTLTGHPPSLELLEKVQAGVFSNPQAFEAEVRLMLNSPEALELLDFFHASWLEYYDLGEGSDLEAQMREESKQMIKKIVFDDNSPWREILRLDQTYVSRDLASHYGMPEPENPTGGWVSHGDNLRRGLLGTGSFLSIGKKGTDTSITQRGYDTFKKVFCGTVPPPPPNLDVDGFVTDPSNPNACKEAQHRAVTYNPQSFCYTCHSRMDGIGIGLENYDALGRFREHEPDREDCVIEGQGYAVGYGDFVGPAGLGEAAYKSRRMEYCLVQHWAKLSQGINDLPDGEEVTESLFRDFIQDGNLKEFLLRQVLSENFRMRVAFNPEGLSE